MLEKLNSNNERHYPQAFKFAMVGLLTFDVVILYSSPGLMISFFCAVMFLAILNGWAAAEDDSMQYGDLYLLNDAICSAMYFLTLLELNDGRYDNFWLYSGIIFAMYALWNILLLLQRQGNRQVLQTFLICDIGASIFSFYIFVQLKLSITFSFSIFIQIVGLIMWVALLLVWYVDFYIRTFKPKSRQDLLVHNASMLEK